MIDLIKIDKKIEEILEIVDYKNIYKLVKDDKTIGYGTINKDIENLIYIFIEEKSRGEGYGHLLFEKMVEEVKKDGAKEIRLIFRKDNIKMLKIVTRAGGLHLSTIGENVKYVVPMYNN